MLLKDAHGNDVNLDPGDRVIWGSDLNISEVVGISTYSYKGNSGVVTIARLTVSIQKFSGYSNIRNVRKWIKV